MSSSPSYPDLMHACRRHPPRVALVLGSGLGDLADGLEGEVTLPYGDVPDLQAPSVAGHKGELCLGTWAGQRVLLFVGRLHYYEGHPWRRVEQQVPMARELGAEIVLLTNAAGGIRDDLVPGSLMPIRDHLDWTRGYPWPSVSDSVSPYSKRLLEVLYRAARDVGESATPGVYAQVTGPSYETPAEIRALRSCGADVVGMSTGREIKRAHALGMECAALSCITNRAAGLADSPIHHDDVVNTGRMVRARLSQLVERFLLRV